MILGRGTAKDDVAIIAEYRVFLASSSGIATDRVRERVGLAGDKERSVGAGDLRRTGIGDRDRGGGRIERAVVDLEGEAVAGRGVGVRRVGDIGGRASQHALRGLRQYGERQRRIFVIGAGQRDRQRFTDLRGHALIVRHWRRVEHRVDAEEHGVVLQLRVEVRDIHARRRITERISRCGRHARPVGDEAIAHDGEQLPRHGDRKRGDHDHLHAAPTAPTGVPERRRQQDRR